MVTSIAASVVACAVMYASADVLHTATLPDLLQDRLVLAIPGPVFGILIDKLQHGGKVLSEALLVILLVALLSLLGAAFLAVARNGWCGLALVLPVVAWVTLTVTAVAASEPNSDLGRAIATCTSWTAVFASYVIVLGLGSNAWVDERLDGGRRRLLKALVVALGGVATGTLGLGEVQAWSRVLFAPESSLRGLSPALTPTEVFYVVSKNLTDPTVDSSNWALELVGLCRNATTFTLAELKELPAVTEYVTLECISNPVGGKLISTGEFTGVPLRDLVQIATPLAEARSINFRSRDGYTESLDLASVMTAPDVLLAYSLNGSPLSAVHGYPARLVVPGRYGMKSAKWLDQLDLASDAAQGFWERQGWAPDTPIHTTARIDVPSFPAFATVSAVALGGIAFAGTRGISQVEWSADGGQSWKAANLEKPLGPLTWQRWTDQWTPPGKGVYTLSVRARDGFGHPQESQSMGSFSQGATGYHSIVAVVQP